MKILKYFFIFVFTFLCVFSASALEIHSYRDMQVKGDWILSPGKIELVLDPGESVTRELKITNRTGNHLEVSVDIEDFTGDNQTATKLLGAEKGPFSLRNYIKPEKGVFQLAHGEKATLPVTIEIPEDAEPGGLYGTAIIRTNVIDPTEEFDGDETKGQMNIISRVATLFFVRVKGEVRTEGRIKSFNIDKDFYTEPPVNFHIVYDNTGSVHLNPYGNIEIKNILGKKIDEVEISPWFIMPGFVRDRDVQWSKKLALGRYIAELNLNRGYDNKVDTAQVSFWIVPVKQLAIVLGVILLISTFIWWFGRTFEFKRKK